MTHTLETQVVDTNRLKVHVRMAGPADGRPVVFVHGNVSDSRFFLEQLQMLPAGLRGYAPDLRGYGLTDPLPVDATAGLKTYAQDNWAALDALDIKARVLLVGHSVGGGVVQQMAMMRPDRVAGLLLEAPVSPFGFGGTRDVQGTPSTPDFAGSGGGTANPDFVARLRTQDRTEDSQTSPRKVLLTAYVKPPFRPAHEEALLDAALSTRVGDGHYPGDLQKSPHWPSVAPGTRGMNNALSPRYLNLKAFADINPRPPVVWVRGTDDAIVSDTSFFDLGFLGQLGAVPHWPGADKFPPQPMVGQTRAVLDRYRANGASVEEVVWKDCGHSPHLERPAEFARLLADLAARTAS